MTFCKLQSFFNFQLFFDPNNFFKGFFQGLKKYIYILFSSQHKDCLL